MVRLVSVLVLLQLCYFGVLVARARERFGIKAPAVAGHEIFERYYRVQVNSIELLVLFLPALWMAVGSIGESWLAGLGAVYLIGRFVYLRAYVAQPARRSLGFILTALPTLALLIIDLVVALRTLAAR